MRASEPRCEHGSSVCGPCIERELLAVGHSRSCSSLDPSCFYQAGCDCRLAAAPDCENHLGRYCDCLQCCDNHAGGDVCGEEYGGTCCEKCPNN